METDSINFSAASFQPQGGIPNYPPGHLANVEAIYARVATHAGLYLGGNAYRGIAMNDCMRSGRELGERVAAGMG